MRTARLALAGVAAGLVISVASTLGTMNGSPGPGRPRRATWRPTCGLAAVQRFIAGSRERG
jgi:hypothetical protein